MGAIVFGIFLIGMGMLTLLRGHLYIRHVVSRKKHNGEPKFLVDTVKFTGLPILHTLAILAIIFGVCACMNYFNTPQNTTEGSTTESRPTRSAPVH